MSLGRVAVTGGTGFIGAHLVKALTLGGWNVRMLVRPGRDHRAEDGVDVITGDLDDTEALDRLLDGASVLVHAAGAVKARSRRDFLATNRDGTRRLGERAARSARRPRVIALSSLAARAPHLSDYAESKALGEQALRQQPIEHLTILRPSAVYGPGDRETGAWLRSAAGPLLPVPNHPQARLCLIHVEDVAGAVAALCRPEAPAGIFELSDRRVDGYTWREIAETACLAAGGTARIIEVPPAILRGAAVIGAGIARLTGRAVMLTPGKAREILQPDWGSRTRDQPPASLWTPVWPLEEGLAQTFRTLRPAKKDQRKPDVL